MEYLGNLNLFTSVFINGCSISKNNNLELIATLKRWESFKSSGIVMDKDRVKRTQYTAFLEEIDLNVVRQNLFNYVSAYKKSYPYGKKQDFIDYVYFYTLGYLKEFVSRDYRYLFPPPNEDKYHFYQYFHKIDKEFLEFVIPSDKTIEHFKQYFKEVIMLISDVEFDSQEKTGLPVDYKQSDLTDAIKQVDSIPESLKDLITHAKSEEIVEFIKVRFKNIRGKRLKLLLLALQQLKLLPAERIAAKFHRCCDKEFNWNVASYNAMNDYIFNNIQDTEQIEEIKSSLKSVIE